jgi:hypothetical protein
MDSVALRRIVLWLIAALAAALLVAFILSWVSSGYTAFKGWSTFLGFSITGLIVLGSGWALLTRTETLPRWLFWLTITAILLRLGIGILWFTILPQYGYRSPSEMNGYVMSDAFKRDTAAWELATSEKRLTAAYGGKYSKADQYGGLLILSAALYRFFNGETHPRLGMVFLTATFSSLAVPFVWAFARRGWSNLKKGGNSLGVNIAALAAWGLVIYPEAVLQGSTQMREAFLITLVIVAFYGLAHFHQKHNLTGPLWILGAVLLTAFLSPPVAGLLLLALVMTTFVWGGILGNRFLQKPWFWIGASILLVLIVAGSFYSLERLTNQDFKNPLEMLGWWFRKTAAYQAHLSERASGWVQKIFRTSPEWLHNPLLLSYGVLQPFLPAALIDITGALIWRFIAIWRSIGWFLLLPLLLYAPFRAFSKNNGDALGRALSLVAWLVIILAAFRAGADPWDNVRYRATFASLQIALASWAWISYRQRPDAWLRRALILVGSVLLWFIPWYLARYVYLPWPVMNIYLTIGLGIATAAFLIFIDWALPVIAALRRSKSKPD